jgi:hypothetical protein
MLQDDGRIVETIGTPDLVQQGDVGTLLAIKKYRRTPVTREKYLVVVYRETSSTDGFVLTAYYTNKPRKRVILYERNIKS